MSYLLGESGFVHAIVDVIVRPAIDAFDLLLKLFGE